MKQFISLVLFLTSLGHCQGLSKDAEGAISQFKGVADEYFNWLIEKNPDYALICGKKENLGQTERLSVQDLEERKVKFEDFLTRLEKIDTDILPHRIQVNYLVLEHALKTVVTHHKFIGYGYNVAAQLGDFDAFGQMASQFKWLPLNNKEDFKTYIHRVQSLGGKINDQQKLMEEALRFKKVLNEVSIIKNHSKLIAEDTGIYRTFKVALDYSELSKNDSYNLLGQLNDTLKRSVIPAYDNLTTFMVEQYRPRSRPCVGLWCLTNGVQLYQAHLQFHLSINVTPEYIHSLGLREVARVKAEMKKLFGKIGFNGTIKEFFQSLRQNTSLILNNETDLFEHVKTLVFEKIQPALLKVFKRASIPTLPLKVEEMRENGPFGYYRRGTKYSSFVVNVKEPEKKPINAFLSLALHEAFPGHHMQLNPTDSRAEDYPEFRRYGNYLSHFPTVPAFIPKNSAASEPIDHCCGDIKAIISQKKTLLQGWALYAEKLGYEMGLYENPFDALGQLELELFRACRLVIDSGLHAKRWTHERALTYLLEHSNMPLQLLKFEIDRYITLPGQACSYKVGELRLLELREKAEKELGSRFDVKEFHARVLSVGGRVPLDVYDHVVNWWINETLSASSASVHLTISWVFSIFWMFRVTI